MRRNILACKAPPNNEGYDIICIQPDSKKVTKQIRVQVKSRYQTDCDRAFPVKERTFKAFDCLVVAFPNIGYFYGNTQRHTRTTILAEIGGRAPHLQQRAGDYAPASPRASECSKASGARSSASTHERTASPLARLDFPLALLREFVESVTAPRTSPEV